VAPQHAAAAPVEAEIIEQEHLGRRKRLHGAVSLWLPRTHGETRLCLRFTFLTGAFCRISENFGRFYRRFVASLRPPIILTRLTRER
jgi:hypothetical protein